MKSSAKITTVVSRVLVYLVLTALVALIFTIPKITDFYIENLARVANAASLRTPTISFMYSALVPAFTAIFSLEVLLRNISKGNIFVKKNVTCLKILYISCFAECLIFFGFGFFYLLSFALSFAALFIGVMLRIVMNLMAQSVEIKTENDYTV